MVRLVDAEVSPHGGTDFPAQYMCFVGCQGLTDTQSRVVWSWEGPGTRQTDYLAAPRSRDRGCPGQDFHWTPATELTV